MASSMSGARVWRGFLSTVLLLALYQGGSNVVFAQECPNTTHCGDCLGKTGMKGGDGFGSQCTYCATPLADGTPQCNVRTDDLSNPCGHGCVECFTDTCNLDHQLLWLILVPIAAGVCLFGCIAFYCCCCRGRTQRRIDKAIMKEDKLAHVEAGKRNAKNEKRRDERSTKMDEYRSKYGLGQQNQAYDDPLKESLLDEPDDVYK